MEEGFTLLFKLEKKCNVIFLLQIFQTLQNCTGNIESEYVP